MAPDYDVCLLNLARKQGQKERPGHDRRRHPGETWAQSKTNKLEHDRGGRKRFSTLASKQKTAATNSQRNTTRMQINWNEAIC